MKSAVDREYVSVSVFDDSFIFIPVHFLVRGMFTSNRRLGREDISGAGSYEELSFAQPIEIPWTSRRYRKDSH